MDDFISELEQRHFLELKKFYSNHFPSEELLNSFLKRVFRYDLDERKPRRMLFQVQHFISLATDIDKIRPARDGLRVLFLKCCTEALISLSGVDKQIFYKLFASFFSDEGKEYILGNFSLSSIELAANETEIRGHCSISMDDVLSIIQEMRNMVVHEGNYWELQIFAYDDDSTWLTHIETDKQLLTKETYRNSTKQKVVYHFNTTLQYEKFAYYFVEACIGFVNYYIDTLENP